MSQVQKQRFNKSQLLNDSGREKIIEFTRVYRVHQPCPKWQTTWCCLILVVCANSFILTIK